MLGLCWVSLCWPRCCPLTTLHIRTCGVRALLGHYLHGPAARRSCSAPPPAPAPPPGPVLPSTATFILTPDPARYDWTHCEASTQHHEYGQCTNSVVKRSLFMYLFRYWIELNLIISILNQWRGKIFYCFVEILACFWTILERVFIFLCSVKKKVNRFISKTCFPLKCTRCSKFQSV